MSGIDIASNSALLSVAEKLDTQNIFLSAIAGKDGGLPIKDWGTVQALVRAGLAPKVFSIGDQFTVAKGDTQLVFDVIGFDHDVPVDTQYTHSMTLQLHDCYTIFQFDAPEALYYCAEELPAGTYYFTIHDYDAAYGGNSSYYFTLEKAVPAGGQLDLRWNFGTHVLSCKLNTYESSASVSPIETVSISEGTEGVFLGVADGTYERMNHVERTRCGSNNWFQSGIKQWLNTDSKGGLWWVSASLYDRPLAGNETSGFLSDVDKDFISVLGKVNKRTLLNAVTDGGGYKDCEELIFLLSRSEVYGGAENGIEEGEAYAYYKDFSELENPGTYVDTNRIKYFEGSPKNWWLRSPHPSVPRNPRYIEATGVVNNGYASNAYGVAPGCCVI